MIRIAVHAGSGAIDMERLGPERARLRCEALSAIVRHALDALRADAMALDVVERAVVMLEDCEYFNAGRGSVLNAAGDIEMDAGIMDGRDRRAGAVAAVRTVRNPIVAARRVMDVGEHVLLVGEPADAFARDQGLVCRAPEYFRLDMRVKQWNRAQAGDRVALDHDEAYGDLPSTGDETGTVGAVARDAQGNLAAATSTGGMTNKTPGRVGDTPIIGAGVWADNATCAVSATGVGEILMRAAACADIHGRMLHGGVSLAHACRGALQQVRALGGHGGCIAAGADGALVLEFTSVGMFRSWADPEGRIRTAIFPE
jgi:beta-aspartyl-peptidase (threonine type)